VNIFFISHCDSRDNSAMHVYAVAKALTDLGVQCMVCVPDRDASTIRSRDSSPFRIINYDEAYETDIIFTDGKGPDLIHAWTPRELVRKLAEHLASSCRCSYLVHLEDNEEVIVEHELGRTIDELDRLPPADLDRILLEHRSHPRRYRAFLAKSAGVTALIDRLLEFKPGDLPGLVFWPGFDPEFLTQVVAACDPNASGARDDETILVYNGNIHETNVEEVRSLFLSVLALRRSGRSVKLVKTGRNTVSNQPWIQEAIESGAVTDLGFLPRSELSSVLAAADILVQPGRSDKFNDYRFPSKLPEFFATGKPVILPRTNVGLAVRDGIDALVLAYGNAVEIAQKIELLMDDPAMASRIGAAGREFAFQHLTWSKNVLPLKDFYTRILTREVTVNRPGGWRATDSPGERSSCSPAKLICFYLPQFHPILENDKFWGKGFTEWTNVTRARPNFFGHYQPQLPADLGFYDLRVPEVLEEQALLAQQYGIHGFCFYYYWFGGRRVLDRPLDTMLRSGKPNFPFCLCWANENWTRNWDGAQDEILIAQDYSWDSCERFMRDVIPILRDPRYIRVRGAPVLLVYRVEQLPNALNVTRNWREICAEAGIGEIHLCAVQSFGLDDPRPYGFDAAVEFPPHTKHAFHDPWSFPGINPDFEGYLEDYPGVVRAQLARPWPDYLLYRGVMPAWDNTPRRGSKAHILVHSDVGTYENWLYEMVRQSLERTSQEPLVFINAWNEWAEGAYLEPDQQFGHDRLSATKRALREGSLSQASAIENADANPVGQLSPAGQLTMAHSTSSPLLHASRLYSCFPLKPLSYGTARDYCDSFDNLQSLATANGDLKDCQRPWVLKAILSKVRPKGRLLEIGAGEPIVADLLQQLGHEVWIVDPYDGSGNGPTRYEQYRSQYPNLRFVRSTFGDGLGEIEENSLDCIFSISVLEHVPRSALHSVFKGMRRFLRHDGSTIHAIDHVHKGNGAEEHLANLRCMMNGFGFQQEELDDLLAALSQDTETYYLSAESHNRWRAGVPYDQFPMRVCVSIQVVAEANRLC
jgi:glycosyltransferase involved in cell wall biosynthesis